MTRVLVTGATGFIGRHLVRRLADAGHQVRCLIRNESRRAALPPVETEVQIADLRSPTDIARAVRNCEQVYHLAALTSARRACELYHTNAGGSQLLAAACARQSTPPRLLIVSSLAAAGPAIAGRRRTESDPPRPVSNYGRSKRFGEQAAIQWADEVPISIVRPAIVFGPGNRELLPMFRSIARFRIHATPGYTARRVGMIHFNDLLEIIDRVITHGEVVSTDGHPPRNIDGLQARNVPGHGNGFSNGNGNGNGNHANPGTGYYLVADPECPTYAELGRMIAKALGASALVLPVAEPIAWLAAAGNQVLQTSLGRSDSFNLDKMREAFAGHWISSPTKLQQLGFRPPKSLQTRLDETAAWYRSQGWV